MSIQSLLAGLRASLPALVTEHADAGGAVLPPEGANDGLTADTRAQGESDQQPTAAPSSSSDQQPPAPSKSGPSRAAALAFVVGGVGTIIAAIGDFGSDSSGLAAARRNHVTLVVAAAAAAAFGLACGALYQVLKPDAETDGDPSTAKAAPAGIAVPVAAVAFLIGLGILLAAIVLGALSQWTVVVPALLIAIFAIALTIVKQDKQVTVSQKRASTGILVLGALAVAAGVAMGAIATSAREPGRPTIGVTRVDDKTLLITVHAEGLPSYDWYELSATGFKDSKSTSTENPIDLVSARFSPGQDGKIDWQQRVDADGSDGTKVGWVLVRVRHNLEQPENPGKSGDPTAIRCETKEATCLAVSVPVTPDASASTPATTTGSAAPPATSSSTTGTTPTKDH